MNIRFKPAPQLADAYAALKAKQAELAKEEKALKEALLRLNSDAIEGTHARVTISHIAETEVFDAKAGKALLEAAGIELPMTTRAASVRFAVKARVADASVEVA